MWVPLQVIRPGVLVLSFGAKGTNVSRGFVDQAVSDHFVLPLEALAAFGAVTFRAQGSSGDVFVEWTFACELCTNVNIANWRILLKYYLL